MNNTLLTVDQLSMKKMIYHTLRRFKLKFLRKMPWREDSSSKQAYKCIPYECSGSNSVETKQPYDFVFSILVVTLHIKLWSQ